MKKSKPKVFYKTCDLSHLIYSYISTRKFGPYQCIKRPIRSRISYCEIDHKCQVVKNVEEFLKDENKNKSKKKTN